MGKAAWVGLWTGLALAVAMGQEGGKAKDEKKGGKALGAEDKRDERVVVPLTKAELQTLEQAAKKAHLDLPDFVRSRVLEWIEVGQGEGKTTEETADNEKTTTEDFPLKGWKIGNGEWRKEKNGAAFSGEAGHLEWEAEITEAVEIQFSFTVRKWLVETPPGAVLIVWSHGHAGVSANHFRIGPDTVTVAARPKKPDLSDTNIPLQIPLNTRIPVRASITKRGIRVLVKGEKVDVAMPCENIGKLQLSVIRADAVFSEVKVKVK
ncbi:MAG: hypothetical protein AB1696_28255 [Planctomycetota bacterium]